MADQEHKRLLDRDIFGIQIRESFKGQLMTLEQIVNYGTNLIPRCFESSSKGVHDTVIILSFLKHAVTSLDGIHILVKEGATLSCIPLLRSLFEINLYLEWIFTCDTQDRATAYYVWEQRKKIFWFNCYIDGTNEFKAHAEHMKCSLLDGFTLQHPKNELLDEVARITQHLQDPDLCAVNQRFDDYINSQKKPGKRPDWYQPFGPRDIREMARGLGKEGEYKVIYSQFSQMIHGLSFYRQVAADPQGGKVRFEPIRTLSDLDNVLVWSFNFAIDIFHRVIERYRSGEMDAFSRKYLLEWRRAVTSVPTVEAQDDGFTISRTPPLEISKPPK